MTLSEGLKAPVLLFPISFHMNRGPAGWGNPREMTSWMATSGERKSTDLTSSLNFALSQRLLQRPLVFLKVGDRRLGFVTVGRTNRVRAI